MKVENLTVTVLGEVQKGVSKAQKEWQKMTFVGTTAEEYNNTYAFEIFGEEKIANFVKYSKVGSVIDVDFNISCNEWKGKYFTSLSYWKSFKSEGSTPAQSQSAEFPNVENEDPEKLVDQIRFWIRNDLKKDVKSASVLWSEYLIFSGDLNQIMKGEGFKQREINNMGSVEYIDRIKFWLKDRTKP